MAFDFSVYKSKDTKIFDIIDPADGETVLAKVEIFGHSTAEHRTAINRMKAVSQISVLEARKDNTNAFDKVGVVASVMDAEVDSLVAVVKQFIDAQIGGEEVGSDKALIRKMIEGIPFVRKQVSDYVDDVAGFLDDPEILKPRLKVASDTSSTKPGSTRPARKKPAAAKTKPQ